MTDTLKLTDFDLIMQEETFEPTPCESQNHHLGIWGHSPDEGASFLVVPTCGCSWAACAGWVHQATEACGLYGGCDCGQPHTVYETRFLPLTDTSK